MYICTHKEVHNNYTVASYTVMMTKPNLCTSEICENMIANNNKISSRCSRKLFYCASL